jgi:hypothetical protein
MNHDTCSRCGKTGDATQVQRHVLAQTLLCVGCMTPDEVAAQRRKLFDLRGILVDVAVGGHDGRRTVVVSGALH